MPTRLTDEEAAHHLAALYGAPTAFSQFSTYMVLDRFDQALFLNSVGPAMQASGSDVLVQAYYQYEESVQLYLRAIPALENSASFKGSAQPYQVFVALDRISFTPGNAKVLVPYHTAALLSAAFVHGLVTRLVLQKYADAWGSIKPSVTLPYPLTLIAMPPQGSSSSSVPVPFNASDWLQKYVSNLSAKLMGVGSWSGDYFKCLAGLTDASLQAAGIVTGWLAGDALVSETVPKNCVDSVWTLLRDKYSTKKFGSMIGYTFSYLSGFLSSERTSAMADGLPPLAQLSDSAKIYDALIGNQTSPIASQQGIFSLSSTFFRLVLGEFYAIAGETSPDSPAKYGAFLQGFEEGLMDGANVMFLRIFQEGYQLGYTAGFRDGFSQGYSAGWTAGYAQGYQAGQSTWISGFQSILDGVSSLISDSSTLETVLSDTVTVGTVIASL